MNMQTLPQVAPTGQETLDSVADLVAAGAAVHLLRPRSKAPIASGWSTAPRANLDDLRAACVEGCNVGIRLGEPSKTEAGYLHTLDLDVRKPEAEAEAWAALRRLVPTADELPTVISGSGTGRHFYFFSDTPLRSRKLAKGDGWEIELFGTGKQAVLPPSIHPDTGQPYRWKRAIPLDLLSVGVNVCPTLHFDQSAEPEPEATDAARDSEEWFTDIADYDRIKGALRLIKDASDRETWLNIGMALHEESGGSDRAFRLWCNWSKRCPSKYSDKAQRDAWRSFARYKGKDRIGIGTLFEIAKEWGWTGSDESKPEAATSEDAAAFFEPVSMWAATPAPPREWLVPEYIPNAAVTLLSGDGGTGKSLLALQLGVSVATGKPWLGQPIERPGKVLFLSAEDSRDELHRRLEAICDGDLSGLDRLHARSVVDGDPLLATFDRQNRLQTTKLFETVLAAVEQVRPSLLVLDTLANLHSGDENNKAHAMQFVNRLKAIATRFNCAVLLLTHPSLSGMANGSGAAGNVGWSNNVRSRLFLSRIKDQDGREWDQDVRSLTTTKSNYGRNGSRIDVRWHHGRFVAEGDAFDEIESRDERGERVFLKLLARFTEEGSHVSRNQSPTYAPTTFAAQPDAEGCGKADLEAAMNRLFLSGRIRNATHRTKGKDRTHIELTPGQIE